MNSRTLLEWWEFTLGPSGWAVLLVSLIAIAIPVSLHVYWFYAASTRILPSFLLIGPSGAGKTSILTLFERGAPSKTHISQAPSSVECSLPISTTNASNQYRSVNDPGAKYHRSFLLADTPGHGKLRHYALDSIVHPQHLKGIIFVVDAATLSSSSGEAGDSTLLEAAQYLHDVLLSLQRRATSSKSGKGEAEMPILIAANKLDLFTALPAQLVKQSLQAEITRLRDTKSKGLLDSGLGMDDGSEDRDVLGGGGEGKFHFGLMEEYNIPIEVLGGSVLASDGSADVKEWWDWIGRHL